MAKKKQDNKVEDEEDIDSVDSNENEDDDEDDDDEDSDTDEDAAKKEDSFEGEDDEQSDDDDDEAAAKKAQQEELEEKRARRRREKKMRRERDKRERMQLQNTIITMATEIKNLKDGHGEVNKKFEGLTNQQIDSEISELGKIYNQAQAVMEAAIADGDGKRFTQAKALSDKVWARYTFLEARKGQRPKSTSDDSHEKSDRNASQREESSADGSSEGGVQLGSEGKRYGIAFIKKNRSWYDPNGNNRDSKILITIDKDLYDEGYDPETKEYWDELEARGKEVLPHRFKGVTGAKPKPKSIVGGGGNDSSLSGSAEKTLPKEFVQTLKVAGYWEDPAKRKAAIKDFYKNRKGA